MIDLVVARTALEMIPRTPDVRLGDVGMMTYRVIRAHELFHFAVEAAAAVISIDLKQDCYRPTFWSVTRIELEEKLATAVEMGTPHGWKDRPNWPHKEVRRAFEDSWEKIPRPYPYNDWQSCEGSMPVRLDDLTSELGGRQLGQLVALAYDTAPSRAAPTRLAEWHLPFRAMSSMALSTLRRPSLSLVMRHARRSLKRGLPPGATLESRSGGDHPVKLKAPGKKTVPIPVKHDRMNDHVVAELAEFFGITKAVYLDELRAL